MKRVIICTYCGKSGHSGWTCPQQVIDNKYSQSQNVKQNHAKNIKVKQNAKLLMKKSSSYTVNVAADKATFEPKTKKKITSDTEKAVNSDALRFEVILYTFQK